MCTHFKRTRIQPLSKEILTDGFEMKKFVFLSLARVILEEMIVYYFDSEKLLFFLLGKMNKAESMKSGHRPHSNFQMSLVQNSLERKNSWESIFYGKTNQ